MKKLYWLQKFIICFVLSSSILLSGIFIASADTVNTAVQDSEETPYKSYTYWSNYTTEDKTAAYSKPMYKVGKTVSAAELSLSADSKLTDMTTDKNGNVYILDSALSKIYILDSALKPTSVIDKINSDTESLEFKGASGIYVDASGLIYVSDTENARVIACDNTGTLKKEYLLPESELIPTEFKFRPIKAAVDNKGYTYILSDGSYYGAILYSPEMEFLGFFGANNVKGTVLDILKQLWKRLTSNDTKRAADRVVIPYTFTDIAIGKDNFVYTATGRSGSAKIQQGQIKLYNPGGKEVMGKDDFNFADSKYGRYEHAYMIQDISYLDVDDDKFFYALDVTTGRIYWYSQDSSLLSVFGGNTGDGTQKGTFSRPVAIAVKGTQVLVCDGDEGSVTAFDITEFGNMVRTAQVTALKGDYAENKATWQEIISLDGNCQLGYKGLAKACYETKDYGEAMKYAKQGFDKETYAKAFKAKRTEFFEEYFALIFAAVLIIAAGVFALYLVSKRREIKFIKNERLKVALSGVAHPSECFRLVKEKSMGSVLISVILLVLFYVLTVLSDTTEGFAFSTFNQQSYNSFYVLFSTVGLVLLWTLSNWLVSTLAGGIGKMKEIFIVTCYCLIPIIFGCVMKLVLTHILIPEEAAFLGILITCCMLYALFMLIIGIMRIHDFSFSRFLATAIFSVIGILIIIFLIILVFLLSQQLFGWIGTVFVEMRYR